MEKGAPVRGFVVISAKFSAVGCLMSLGAVDHGVAGCHPFGFGGDTAAASSVDEDAGVGEDGSRAVGWEAEFAKEDAEAEDCFGAADGLEEFGGAGGVADGRGQVA